MRRLLTVALVLGCAGDALAQSAQDQAAAEAAWQEGRRLMLAKKYEQACAKFAVSQRLDPAIGTLLNLGDCQEKLGKTASAWINYLGAESLARQQKDAKRQKTAHERSERLAPKLVKIQIDLAAPTLGLKVRRDGEVVDEGLLGTAIPVDPGEHVVTAEAPGTTAFEQKIAATGEGKVFTVTVPKLEPPRKEPPRKEPPPPVVVVKPAPPPSPPPPEIKPAVVEPPPREPDVPGRPRQHGRVVLALAVGGGGIAVAGVGAFFGLSAISTWNDSKAHCDANTLCDQTGYDLVKDAQSKAMLSNVLIGVGAAAVVTGVILYLTAPREPAPETSLRVVPEIGPGRFALTLSRGF